jgi:hypothetical protein
LTKPEGQIKGLMAPPSPMAPAPTVGLPPVPKP